MFTVEQTVSIVVRTDSTEDVTGVCLAVPAKVQSRSAKDRGLAGKMST